MAVFDDDTEQRLLANDSTLTSLTLCSSDVAHLPNYSLRVGQALARSTHLAHLDLEVNVFHDDIASIENGDDIANTAFDQAMNYILSRPTLESLRLVSRGFNDHYTPQVAIATKWLCRAINDRTTTGLDAVMSVSFHCLILEAESMVALFQNGGLRQFRLDCCIVSPDSFARVARSFASCTTLTELGLVAFSGNVAFVCALLEEAEYKGKIDTLALGKHGDNEEGMLLATALSKFLRTSPSALTFLCLHGFSWTGQSFAPIAESVSTAETVLNLASGSMDSEACTMLRSMYPPHSDAQMLILFLDMKFPDTNDYQTLMELIGSTPGLTALTLRINDSNTAVDRQQFVAITSGLKSKSCAIQTLGLLGSASDSLYETFLNALPQFCFVEKLEMERLAPPEHWDEELMEGFRKNRSLKEVSIEGLDASNRSRLDVYLQRNKELPTVIQLEALAFSSQSATSEQRDCATVASSKSLRPQLLVVVPTLASSCLRFFKLPWIQQFQLAFPTSSVVSFVRTRTLGNDWLPSEPTVTASRVNM